MTPGEGRPLEDRALAERAADGDVDAYEELVSRYQGIAQRVAYLILGAEAETQDVVQDAFVKAYYALGRFRVEASFRSWLLAIVANEAKNRRRSQARRTSLALRAAEGHSSADAAPSPEETVLSRESRRGLVEALNRLSERDRLVIAYRYFEELSEKEMAEALGCRPGTVKSRLSRALGRLRTQLGRSGGDPATAEVGGEGAP